MLKNYFKIALRNLTRHKGYAAINVAGLAVGIAACLLLFIVVKYELSYDKFQQNYTSAYRIVTEDTYSDGTDYQPGVPCPLLDAVRTRYPQIKVAGLNTIYGSQVTIPGNVAGNNDKKFKEDIGMFFMEPQMFDILSYHFLSGNAAVLKEPNNAVLTKATAIKYFGDWNNAVGKIIRLDNALNLKVAAILDDVPANTDIPLRVIASYITFKNNPELYNYTNNWGNTSSNHQVFALLPQNISVASFNGLLKDFSKKQYEHETNSKRIHYLHPLSEMHFDTRFGNLGDHVTTKATIWTLVLIGILIIVMACINFINLSTAQAVGRSKEVGVRKVLGSNRLQLFWQMMGETSLVVLFALVLALLMAKISLPYIKHIASVPETLPLLSASSVLFLLAIVVIVTSLSGFYPSLILSGFKPALALKNKITSASVGGISLRRGLVVLQFGISQVLIIGTIIAISQMNYIRTADLGFNKNALYILHGSSDSISVSKQTAFRQSLLNIPGVQNVSFSTDVPSSDNNWGTNFFYNGKELPYTLFLKFGDADYIKTYGLQLIAGHNYTESDTVRDVLINETLVKKLGIQNLNEVLGKNIRMGGGGPWRQIAGVVKDFKTNSLRDEVKPIMIACRKKLYTETGIKLRTTNITATRAAIEDAWNKYYPDFAFNANFLDESIANFYRQEEQLSLLYKIFAGLAIFISCLGLYGLVSFMAVQRTKEVGIRKVLGASVGNIVYLFSKEFTLLILIAFVIATPIAWYMMNSWLHNFVYRINFSIGVFGIAIGVSVVIAWVTVGYKAVRAALVNPVKSLRSE